MMGIASVHACFGRLMGKTACSRRKRMNMHDSMCWIPG